MKKLSLDLDQLQVESFSTAKDAGERGTIGGHINTGGCTIFYSDQETVCSWCDEKDEPDYGSGHITCGKYSRCNGNSIDLCWSDYCQ